MNNELLLKQFAKGNPNQTTEITGGNAIIYNRVSSKEQLDGASLETQLEKCLAYAESKNFNVIEPYFGGTFESAKSDKERKEFNKMLSFIKKNKHLKIKAVIVYMTARFSRTGSTSIIEELEKMDIMVLSASSGYNPKTPSGKLNQRVELALASFDNESKSQTTIDNSIKKLQQGRWVNHAPRGYDQKTTKAKQTITINAEGKFIRQAFHWKAEQKLTTEEIRKKLKNLGFTINKQKLSELLRNPFYCGWMSHKFLKGELLKGNHPAIVSEKIFLKANEVLKESHSSGYEITHNNEFLPLLGTIKCPHCGNKLSPSVSTKMRKKYNRNDACYYVCWRKGCCSNNSIRIVHPAFNNLFSSYSVQEGYKEIFKLQLSKVFNGMNSESKSLLSTLKGQATELSNRIKTIEDNWAIETNSKKQEILWKKITEYEKDLIEVQKEIEKHKNNSLNLQNFLDNGVNLIYNPLKLWELLDLEDKKRLQQLVFPNGFIFDKENKVIEPPMVNSLFGLNALFTETFDKKEKGFFSKKTEKPQIVPGAGLEPAQP